MKTQRVDMADYTEKKQIFADLTKEAKALGLKDITEGVSEGQEEVYGILPKKYKDTSGVQVTLQEVDTDKARHHTDQIDCWCNDGAEEPAWGAYDD